MCCCVFRSTMFVDFLRPGISPLHELFFLETKSQTTSLGFGVLRGMCWAHSLTIRTDNQFGIFDAIQLNRTAQTGSPDNPVESNGFPGFFGSTKWHGNTGRDFNLHRYATSIVCHGLRIKIGRIGLSKGHGLATEVALHSLNRPSVPLSRL